MGVRCRRRASGLAEEGRGTNLPVYVGRAGEFVCGREVEGCGGTEDLFFVVCAGCPWYP